jgi:hypothetical protein
MGDYQAASDFQPLPGEANFPPPILKEVVGGMHIAPECITLHKGQFIMAIWPNGLPRHEVTRTVRFPHGLMRFGETILEAATRLVGDQLGLNVEGVRALEIDSYVDEMKHWHIEPLLLVTTSGEPKVAAEASGVVTFQGTDLPEGSVWGRDSFQRVYSQYLSDESAAM